MSATAIFRTQNCRSFPHQNYQLKDANAALDDLRAGRLSGATVLTT